MLAYIVIRQFSHGFLSYSAGDLLTPESPAVKVYNLKGYIEPVYVLSIGELKGIVDEIENINPDKLQKEDLSKVKKLLKDLKRVCENEEKRHGK
jgi:hypothetical protein